jgi:hypothetical protein
MAQRDAPRDQRRLIVPLLLAVTTTTALAAALSTASCGDQEPPRVDAGIHDAPIDTPIV